MEEKIKHFASKTALSDEELEIVLFGMNKQNAAYHGLIFDFVDKVRKNIEFVSCWAYERLGKDDAISDGLRKEMLDTMRGMSYLENCLKDCAQVCRVYEEAHEWKYRDKDVCGHLIKK